MLFRNGHIGLQELSPRGGLSCLWMVILCVSIGCAPPGAPRQAVEGRVTLNGKPASDLRIIFLPGDAEGVGATGLVTDGQFSISQEDGPSVGRHDVVFEKMEPELEEFESLREAGERPLSSVRLAPRFTKPGALQVNITPDSVEPLEFQLTSR